MADAHRKAMTEPAAEMRAAAAGMWQMYVALTHEGFSSAEALTILGAMLAASISKGET